MLIKAVAKRDETFLPNYKKLIEALEWIHIEVQVRIASTFQSTQQIEIFSQMMVEPQDLLKQVQRNLSVPQHRLLLSKEGATHSTTITNIGRQQVRYHKKSNSEYKVSKRSYNNL